RRPGHLDDIEARGATAPRSRRRQIPLQLRISPPRRAAIMDPRIQPPPAPLSRREESAHHQIGQPGWASHLVEAAMQGGVHPREWEEATRRAAVFGTDRSSDFTNRRTVAGHDSI